MDHHHPGAAAGGGLVETLPPVLALLVCAGLYLHLVGRARRRNPAQGWNGWRTASFGLGLLLLAVAFLPPLASLAHTDFRGHMAQHLLVGMYAPLALVLGAPVTLLLRALPTAAARALTAVLRARAVRLVTHPAVASALSTGSLVALYLTPLHPVATGHPAGHWLLHGHFLLSGYLFAYVIAGPDPAPARPGVRTRLVYLGLAIVGHATVSQLMYGGWAYVPAPVEQVRGGAELMYYGGDIAELLLAAALVTTWRPVRRPRVTRLVPTPARVSAGAGRAGQETKTQNG
ncbi:cytochrome c oxidase assembly protein [Micromonospora sp. WMMD882]|uniref:cytochrome c oxidase assembly protein n=1 Tax=Micromonospora sp. WMMD882 TaxID=3015151 RepID=UPI00248AF662|nr:cytochrome c oxidase assembly protein [Micromonospora sp. WMMD882]WBB78717.1 cytochrome c oxidase assembly protein [Micromonospora sp. WMMD882]